ncbi:pentatricopeptide repeat-containing protein At4g21065-like [Selaginella moellendorffii]|uniref:pentatricopeptide repeat-containing protein At4g21065-like n=1 Tax=Selaginella moellendorffii TaxID=88036 RepID=UPI000D1CC696|nr:pentatricopeptide repeat-containing protein At4g21065-like [Selaginella moellendorffii]|eukprot:XP_024536003.1 pentatricopeptide repeat-containing protein At4g21065-like [Selaginella moellendorffii]
MAPGSTRSSFTTNPTGTSQIFSSSSKEGASAGIEQGRCLSAIHEPNRFSWNLMLGAYAQNADLEEAKELKEERCIVVDNDHRTGREKPAPRSSHSLHRAPYHDDVVWTAMILAYSNHGHLEEARKMFARMPQHVMFSGSMAMEGEARNEISFQGIFLTCNHGGKLRVALDYFRSMVAEYSISPNVIHFQAMADVLGRAGLVAKAEGLLLVMPFQPHFLAWKSLISACKVHGNGKNINVAARAAEKLLEMKPGDSGALRAHIALECPRDCQEPASEKRQTTLINVAGDWKRPY